MKSSYCKGARTQRTLGHNGLKDSSDSRDPLFEAGLKDFLADVKHLMAPRVTGQDSEALNDSWTEMFDSKHRQRTQGKRRTRGLKKDLAEPDGETTRRKLSPYRPANPANDHLERRVEEIDLPEALLGRLRAQVRQLKLRRAWETTRIASCEELTRN